MSVSDVDLSEARRLQDALREMAAEGRTIVRAAPFTGYLDRADDLRYLNYAVPDRDATPPWSPAAIAALVDAFAAEQRVPRLEIVEACWPGLVDALVASGFTVEGRIPGMTCAPEALVTWPAPDDVVVADVPRDAPAADIRAVIEAQRSSFGDVVPPAPVTESDITAARGRSGGSVAALASDGSCLGAASWLGIRLGVSEVAGVGVLAAHRGRGIASALTSAAARAAFDAGAELAFLTPGGEGAQRAYSRVGFRERLRCAHIARD